jgi:formylglycine-generating enzyme required for sulfatase activity
MGEDLGTAATGNVTPVHTVTLTGFQMSKYPVTQAQYEAVMGSNPSNFKTNITAGEVQENRPVEQVSWYDALVFCNKLSKAEGLAPAYEILGSDDPDVWGTVPTTSNSYWNAVIIVAGSNGYRLPTEAQWEYAAKGGSLSQSYTYAGSDTVGDVAWYATNGGGKTHEVGKKDPNELNLYDMSGNVVEWCWDWYGTYSGTAQTDPLGAVSGSSRVVRGGYWDYSAENVRSAYRVSDNPSNRFYGIGFRLVRP